MMFNGRIFTKKSTDTGIKYLCLTVNSYLYLLKTGSLYNAIPGI